ncbi:hypothetical protein CEXT_335591 [Caerostris extrusa]|uniref:Ribosomal protein S14 n=1 Tax=Caerostris extrusa TaxID=172846 RepID=A0AAV4W328_CAEEX|nr:hypothetical protein CEXT_335591 [Caerostris extrusa]
MKLSVRSLDGLSSEFRDIRRRQLTFSVKRLCVPYARVASVSNINRENMRSPPPSTRDVSKETSRILGTCRRGACRIQIYRRDRFNSLKRKGLRSSWLLQTSTLGAKLFSK